MFISVLAEFFPTPSPGERTPVRTRMQRHIPENWFLCTTGRQFSANVWDQETGPLQQQSPTTLPVRRVMERKDGTSSPGEWYGLLLFSGYSSLRLSMLGELTDIGRKVCDHSFSLYPPNSLRSTVDLCVWNWFAQTVY